MKIMFLTSSLECGGSERSLALLANELSRRGHEISIVQLYRKADNPFFELVENIQFVALNHFGRDKSIFSDVIFNFKGVLGLRSICMSDSPDIIVAFQEWVNNIAVVSILGLAIPLVIAERSNPGYHPTPLIKGLMRRLFYPAAKALVVQTMSAFDYCHRFVSKEKLYIIPNMINIPRSYSQSRQRQVARRQRILAVGRLSLEKGFDLLLRALALILEEFPNWEVIIAGEGVERKRLESDIRQIFPANKVILKGRVKEIAALYNSSDIFVLSSRYEGFPNALCEAMSHGLPCISFNCPHGPQEIISHEQSGILVPPNDVVQLAEAMRLLMSDSNLRQELGANAAATVRKFSIRNVIPMWEALFEECVVDVG